MWGALLVIVALLFASPGVASAQQSCTTDARQVVSELYRHMLERSTDQGAEDWVQQLESGRMSVREVARQIILSEEHMNRFWRTEVGEETPYIRSVDRLYRHILGRQPDAEGARYFAQIAQSQGHEAVVNAMLTSDEYRSQFGEWGVPGSGGVRFCAPSSWSGTSQFEEAVTATTGTATAQRLRAMDRNADGVIVASEWRGSVAEFQRFDRNNDNVLSGTELNAAGRNDLRGTSGLTIAVDPTERWIDTGINVNAGDVVMFDAEGSIQMSTNPNDTATASGSVTGRRAAEAPVAAAPAGGLLARIDNAQPVYVGDRRALRAPANGRLYLGVNDDHLADNTGQYLVTVSIRNR